MGRLLQTLESGHVVSVERSSVQCTVCTKWIHKRCSGVWLRVADGSGVDDVMGQSRKLI